ncbi:MAG: hypothetical protein VW443_00435 [Pseudomonadales bacterium]
MRFTRLEFVYRATIAYTLGCLLLLGGCAALKEATTVGTSAAVGAGVATVASGGVLAPVVGAAVGGGGASLFFRAKENVVPEITKQMGFFELVEELIKIGGWLLILIFVVPWFLGWIVPTPHLRRKDERK